MPLGRYFAFVGPVLLALLFLASQYLPDEFALPGHSVDRTTIRISSEQKWPEKVVIDTTVPTIIPVKPNVIAATTPITPATGKLHSFAEMKPPPAPSAKHASLRPKHRMVRLPPPGYDYPTHMAANPTTTWPPSW